MDSGGPKEPRIDRGLDPSGNGQLGTGGISWPYNIGNIQRAVDVIYSAGSSSDAAFRCYYCSNLFTFTSVLSLITDTARTVTAEVSI